MIFVALFIFFFKEICCFRLDFFISLVLPIFLYKYKHCGGKNKVNKGLVSGQQEVGGQFQVASLMLIVGMA